jgi:hypothetical protein
VIPPCVHCCPVKLKSDKQEIYEGVVHAADDSTPK